MWILGLFSQVLKGLERFVVFEKIWEVRSSGPKNPLQNVCWGLLFIGKVAEAFGGKTK